MKIAVICILVTVSLGFSMEASNQLSAGNSQIANYTGDAITSSMV